MVLIKDLGMQFPKPTSKNKIRYGLYECPDCFKHFKANSYNVKYKNQQGCHSCANIRKNTTHGMTGTTSYNTWRNMMRRCEDPTAEHYNRYGGRGITVCEEWRTFEAYNEWFQETNIPGLTMERMNNEKNYEPSNVKWKDMAHQAQNTTLLRTNNSTGYRGVKTQRRSSKKKGNEMKYIASICVNMKEKHLGIFNTLREAAICRDKYIRKHNLNHTQNFKGEEI